MAYRSIPYSKMPLAKLRELEADIVNKNPDLQALLKLYWEEDLKLNKLKKEHESIQGRIKEIQLTALKRREQDYAAAGRFKKFFTDKTSPRFSQEEINEIIRLNSLLANKSYSNKFHFAYSANAKLQEIRRIISKIERDEAKRNKENAKRNTIKAQIAAYKGKSRNVADRIKSELKEQLSIDSNCPYCGLDIGDDPHCDHIYPVSKGGLSTGENMVYVCSDCNHKKTDLTLTQFIKRYGFPRIEIERRLDKLGKHY
jgi:5-methylcytosine-specific restriction endonuclease McrA